MTIWTPSLSGGRPRYLAIVDAMRADIASGALPSGSQLPPQRDLARALGVSIGTVTRAYGTAEKLGLTRAAVGRGTFVGGHELGSLPFGDTGQTVAGGINLGMTWPLEHLNPDLPAALRKLQRRPDLAELLAYHPNLGMPRHRHAGARWIAAHGCVVEAERVAICSGAQHAMTISLSSLAKSGDTILAGELTYPGVRAVADFLGLKIMPLAMDQEGILPDAFERACSKRRPKALYCVPSLQNPTTATQSIERRQAIVAVARKWGVPIIEDAIHHLLLDPEQAPPLIASLAPELTYLIASPSKVVAGGLRVAFLCAPERAIDALSQKLWATCWMVAPLVAEIMCQWIEDGSALATVQAKREESRARMELLRLRLPSASLRAGVTGFHAWLELPAGWRDGEAFVRAAADRGVALTAASAFHTGSGSAPAGVRVSVSVPHERSALETGLERVASTLKSLPSLGRAIV